MSKMWVDPPSGWQYGFPKIWDTDEEPDMLLWLQKEGYPAGKTCAYVRTWPVESE